MLDSHCHLNDEKLYPIYKEEIALAKQAGVTTLLVVGWDIESSKKAIQIASEFDGVYAAVGIHPENLEGVSESDLEVIKELAKHEKVVAIGEIGLDYHWFKEEKDHLNQQEYFIKQIKLANELNLPISIHARDASEDTYKILKNYPLKRGGVLHCYSGSKEMLKEFAKLGLYFGFDGPITFKNSINPKECVKECPLNRILTETDSPYMTPTPFRGQTNGPKYIPYILKEMSLIKEISVDEIEKQIQINFDKLFHGEHL